MRESCVSNGALRQSARSGVGFCWALPMPCSPATLSPKFRSQLLVEPRHACHAPAGLYTEQTHALLRSISPCNRSKAPAWPNPVAPRKVRRKHRASPWRSTHARSGLLVTPRPCWHAMQHIPAYRPSACIQEQLEYFDSIACTKCAITPHRGRQLEAATASSIRMDGGRWTRERETGLSTARPSCRRSTAQARLYVL